MKSAYTLYLIITLSIVYIFGFGADVRGGDSIRSHAASIDHLMGEYSEHPNPALRKEILGRCSELDDMLKTHHGAFVHWQYDSFSANTRAELDMIDALPGHGAKK